MQIARWLLVACALVGAGVCFAALRYEASWARLGLAWMYAGEQMHDPELTVRLGWALTLGAGLVVAWLVPLPWTRVAAWLATRRARAGRPTAPPG